MQTLQNLCQLIRLSHGRIHPLTFQLYILQQEGNNKS